jgi:hypothetical protein
MRIEVYNGGEGCIKVVKSVKKCRKVWNLN